jgi:hypothetical protein
MVRLDPRGSKRTEHRLKCSSKRSARRHLLRDLGVPLFVFSPDLGVPMHMRIVKLSQKNA